MSKYIVTPDANGRISDAGRIMAEPLPPAAVVVEFEGSLNLEPCQAAVLRDGAVVVLDNFIGSGPWFDQAATLANRLTPRHVDALGIVPPNDLGRAVTPGWQGYEMQPRPLTKAEKDAEAKAKADADAAARAEAVRKLVVRADQLAQAAVSAGLLSVAEAKAWAGAGTNPPAITAAIATLPQEVRDRADLRASTLTEYRRDDPLLEQVWLAIPGVTVEALDALFEAAAAL